MDHLCYFCLVLFCVHARLFVNDLWSPVGKGLTSWLSFVMSNCHVVTFPCGILGQECCLIVSIPDLCHLSYFLNLKGGCRGSSESTLVKMPNHWKSHVTTLDHRPIYF